MTRRSLEKRVDDLEDERPGEGTVITIRDEVVASGWEPAEDGVDVPEPGVTETRIEL